VVEQPEHVANRIIIPIPNIIRLDTTPWSR
jgi:hypothetical protein